jgi:hypothetical protein
VKLRSALPADFLESGQPRVWVSSAQWLLSFDRFLSSFCECFEHAHWSSHNCGNPRDSLLWNSFPRFATSRNPEILCVLPSLTSRKTSHFRNSAPSWYVRNGRFSKGVYVPGGQPRDLNRPLPCLVGLSCRSDLSKYACRTPRLPDILTRTIIPDGVSGYSEQAVCSGALLCQEMDGRSRLSMELRFDPSNLSDYHQIGRRFPSLGENSRSLWLREIVSRDVCLLRRAAEGLF